MQNCVCYYNYIDNYKYMYTSDIDLQNKSYNSHYPLKNERKESLMDSDFVAEQSTIAACFVHIVSLSQNSTTEWRTSGSRPTGSSSCRG